MFWMIYDNVHILLQMLYQFLMSKLFVLLCVCEILQQYNLLTLCLWLTVCGSMDLRNTISALDNLCGCRIIDGHLHFVLQETVSSFWGWVLYSFKWILSENVSLLRWASPEVESLLMVSPLVCSQSLNEPLLISPRSWLMLGMKWFLL